MNPRGWLTRLLGDEGERIAARHLKGKGYRILSRQARSRLGEIDLIARDGEVIVFVEVKSRRDQRDGSPAERVDRQKQKKLTQLALTWLKRRKLLGHPARFDVIAIRWDAENRPIIDHFQSAFEAADLGQMY
jgi:putative endonuclease